MIDEYVYWLQGGWGEQLLQQYIDYFKSNIQVTFSL